MIKRSLLCLLSLCLWSNFLSNFLVVKAYESEQNDEIMERIYDQELKNAIISGDGSADYPYIVDYDKAPNFKRHVESIGNPAIHSFASRTPGISPYGIFDGVLAGKSHGNQPNGGYWEYTSGKPSAIADNKLWMIKVTYLPIAETANVRNLLKDKMAWTIFCKEMDVTLKKPINDAVEYLAKMGIEKILGKAGLTAAGLSTGIYSFFEMVAFCNDCFTYSLYDKAYINKDGMINAVYGVSYHGNWYQHNGEDTWSAANIVYEPDTAYGKGTYKSL